MHENTLVTIPFSHYCEKARWALDRMGVPYREDGHLPLFHVPHVLRAGGRRTVPVLVLDGAVLADSTDILRHLDARAPAAAKLFPTDPAARRDCDALEDLFDARLGPHTRRYMYHQVLADRAVFARFIERTGRGWELAAARRAAPVINAVIRRGLRIDDASAERSRARVVEVFHHVAARLVDGRRYLLGDAFTAADLTFAALATPVLAPPEHPFMPTIEEVPEPIAAIIRGFRETPAGAFALRLYAEDRRAPPA